MYSCLLNVPMCVLTSSLCFVLGVSFFVFVSFSVFVSGLCFCSHVLLLPVLF